MPETSTIFFIWGKKEQKEVLYTEMTTTTTATSKTCMTVSSQSHCNVVVLIKLTMLVGENSMYKSDKKKKKSMYDSQQSLTL